MANWREIPGYEGLYLISDEGDVFSLPKTVDGVWTQHRKGKPLKKGKRGRRGQPQYEFVILKGKDGNSHHESVHRLVALAFLENPANYPEVNHKDENTLNNHVENLEWCTRQYNIEYSKAKSIVQYSIVGEKIAEYKSITYASQLTGISRTAINNCLAGWCKTAGGYVWEYKEGSDDLSH